MLRLILVVILFIFFSFNGNCQNTTRGLYYKCLEYALNDIKPNKLDSFCIIDEEGVISIPKIAQFNLKWVNANLYKGPNDTSFWVLKTMPIEISKVGLILGVGYYNFKQKHQERNMILIANYYSYFRFDCKDQVYSLYKREKKSL